MSYINWIEFAKNKTILASFTKPENSIAWMDCVTGTEFYISRSDYDRYYKIIIDKISDYNPDEIIEYMDEKGIQNSFPYLMHDTVPFLLRDASRIFVLFSYIYYGDIFDKSTLRKDAYEVFFSNKKDKFPKSWESLQKFSVNKAIANSDANIKILKGGSYKIKKYYLENNDLKDMRGASYILKIIGEKMVPDLIRKKYIEETIIYAGGGNFFAVLPSNAGANLPYMLEQIYHDYALCVENAFVMVDFTLNQLLDDYKNVMGKVEMKLDERKKIKLYNTTCPETPFWDDGVIALGDETIKIDAKKIMTDSSCKFCGVRKARYKMLYGEGEEICGSCLHKHLVGREEKHGYIEEFRKFAGTKVDDEPQTLEDLKDANGYTSVLYGDGNNMGAIVQNIKNLAEMMYFSRKVKIASKAALYSALKEADIGTKFEIIAIGGDDIFVIVPGNSAVDISIRLIELFNESFKNQSVSENEDKYSSTMSVGLCIAKYNTPVRLMLHHAEEVLGNAKKISRANSLKKVDNGSMDFIVLDTVEENIRHTRNDSKKECHITMLPYSLNMAKDMVSIVKDMKQDNCVKKTSLYRMRRAVEKMDLFESMLFYDYTQAKNKKILDKVFKSHCMAGLNWLNGYYRFEKGDKPYSPWRDILDLWDFCGGDRYGENNREKI